MLNISYKGKFIDEKQLIGNKKLLKEAVQYEEGEKFEDVFNQGFSLILIIIIPIMIISLIKLTKTEGNIYLNLKTVLSIVFAFMIRYLLKFVHEFIHAIVCPTNSKKTIWRYKKGIYFTYCDAMVSKTRYIIISLAPMIVLGIIPFIIWILIAEKIDFAISLIYVLMTWNMIFWAMGDLANVYNTLKQVPKGGKVFNFGMHSYWIKEKN